MLNVECWVLNVAAVGCSLSPNSGIGMGSARVPRASSGVAPELPSHTLAGISRREKFAGRCFRRDAENHTPEACAPRDIPLRPFSTSEFGLILPVAHILQMRLEFRLQAVRQNRHAIFVTFAATHDDLISREIHVFDPQPQTELRVDC